LPSRGFFAVFAGLIMSNLFDLSEDVAVVIGATGVLGGALADGLAGAGAAACRSTASGAA
jgi:hypothetical protein